MGTECLNPKWKVMVAWIEDCRNWDREEWFNFGYILEETFKEFLMDFIGDYGLRVQRSHDWMMYFYIYTIKI